MKALFLLLSYHAVVTTHRYFPCPSKPPCRIIDIAVWYAEHDHLYVWLFITKFSSWVWSIVVSHLFTSCILLRQFITISSLKTMALHLIVIAIWCTGCDWNLLRLAFHSSLTLSLINDCGLFSRPRLGFMDSCLFGLCFKENLNYRESTLTTRHMANDFMNGGE